MDSLGGHEFIKKNLDTLGDHEFIKKSFDSLGGHEFIKRLRPQHFAMESIESQEEEKN